MKANLNGVIPRLRFPDFDEAWLSASIRDLYEFKSTNTLSRDKLNYNGSGIRNIHYGDIHTKFSPRFILAKEKVPFVNDGELSVRLNVDSFCVAGDMVLADASEDVDDVGKSIEIIDLLGERVVAGLHTILARRIGDELIVGFGACLFRSPAVREQIKRESQGAKVLGISPTRLAGVLLPYPRKPDEQRKISDCLSSLDDCIGAEIRKFDALKTHKQGLMDQLFPAEGQRLPRLRLPEFRGSPDWVVRPLGELVDLLSGYPFEGRQIVADNTGERLMRGVNITEGAIRHNDEIDRYYQGPTESLEKYRLHPGDLVIGMDGSKVGKNSALITKNDAGALLVQRVARLRATSLPKINFIFHQIHAPRFHAYVDRINTSSGIPHVSAKQIKEYPIHSAGELEEQRIAGCLSSLDAQIAAQSKKIAVLKRHKQGLMQGLFPAIELKSP
ncbi:restriction endonuclease subunit S [Xanthomonas euroxanthea]|nr:restriction endonuclease subunit S [Xanthomonas euroxanthea]